MTLVSMCRVSILQYTTVDITKRISGSNQYYGRIFMCSQYITVYHCRYHYVVCSNQFKVNIAVYH